MDGEYIYYWDNGEVRYKGKFKRSCRVGTWRTYDQSGKLIFEEESVSTKIFPKSSLKINLSRLQHQLGDNELSHS